MHSYHQAVVNVSERVHAFFAKTFSHISIDGPQIDPSFAKNNPLMLVSTHRSHVDYFLAGNIFHQLGFDNLRFAAGDNLTKLPFIGPLFKKLGAFTVTRDTGFDRHYVRNLCSEVVSMLEKGDNIFVFPEGGRSYSGEMLDIKQGILGAAVIMQAQNPDQDVYYLPLAISYEAPPDIPWFSLQLKGKKWRKRSNPFIKQLLGSLFYFGADLFSFGPLFLACHIGKKYGAIYIDYLTPVSIRSIIAIPANKSASARDNFSAHRTSMQQLGDRIYDEFLTLYRLLPMHVVAALIKLHRRCTPAELEEMLPPLIEQLRRRSRNVKQLSKLSSTENVSLGIKQLRRMRGVKLLHGICVIDREAIINYYASSIH